MLNEFCLQISLPLLVGCGIALPVPLETEYEGEGWETHALSRLLYNGRGAIGLETGNSCVCVCLWLESLFYK